MAVEKIHLDECESTHKYMRENVANLPEWAIVAAEYQTAGHGRHGRAWIAPKGKNLCFNVLVPTKNLKPEHYAPTTQIAAITMAKIVGAALRGSPNGSNVTVKWPNDVLVAKKKICGIISELLGEYISLGIGLNVNAEEPSFTSIFIETGKIHNKNAILDEFIEKFRANFDILCKEGLELFVEEWRRMGCFIGHRAKIVEGNVMLEGTIEAIQNDGSLLFRTETGLKTVWSGDLEI